MSRRSDPTARLDADLRDIMGDGVAYSVMVGMGEAQVAAFALAVGHGAIVAGLLSSIPPVAGAILQLATPAGVRALGSYRRWVVLCARLQALSFLPLVAGAALGRLPVWALFASGAVYWAAGMAAGAAWNTWVTELVPRPLRASFFARRSRVTQAVVLVAILAAGALLEPATAFGVPLLGFGGLFALAAAARATSASFLAAQTDVASDAALAAAAEHEQGLGNDRSVRALLGFLMAMQLAAYVAAPYFTPFMLGELGMSYGWYIGLTAAAFAGRVLALPRLGLLAERRGARFLLRFGALGITPLPAMWALSHALPYLFVLQTLAGALWAAFELGTMLLVFEAIEPARRTAVLARYNLVSTIAMVCGSAAGAAVLYALSTTLEAYLTVFILSAVLRIATFGLLRGIPDVVPQKGDVPTRTLAVRPSIGAIQRPILAAVSRVRELRARAPR